MSLNAIELPSLFQSKLTVLHLCSLFLLPYLIYVLALWLSMKLILLLPVKCMIAGETFRISDFLDFTSFCFTGYFSTFIGVLLLSDCWVVCFLKKEGCRVCSCTLRRLRAFVYKLC